MEPFILISNLNDFIFCPISIYFHNLYGNMDTRIYQSTDQTKGTHAHHAIDRRKYSNKKNILQGIDIYNEEFRMCGKIDLYDANTYSLVERKRKITQIYDGYIFQIYAQYYCLKEMGYTVDKLYLYSFVDNKKYPIVKPEEDSEMKSKFLQLIYDINHFNFDEFEQTNKQKCSHCIYSESCDRALI